MSSDRIKRKRRSEFDTSDNRADEHPAEKVRRVDSALNLGKKVSEVCKNLLYWITPGFLKKMTTRVSHPASSNFLRLETESSFRSQYPIDVDEDDVQEITVISVQNGTGAHSRPFNSSRMNTHQRSFRLNDPLICPLASTFPYSSDNPFHNKLTRTERKRMNGFSSRREEKTAPKQSEKSNIAPITSPRSEIDILFADGAKKDEVEILSEALPPKHSSFPTRKIRLLSDSRGSRNNRRCLDDLMNMSLEPSYLNRSYTANEVFRLQEKAQYKLLLDKVVKRPALFQPAFSREYSRASAIQVDLTEDDDISDIHSHFKKEKVEGNVKDFLSKYYKPCALVSSSDITSKRNSMQSMSEKETTDDEDVQVIEYSELPTWKPRKPFERKDVVFTEAWLENMKITVSQNTEERLHRVSESEGKVQRYQTRREALNAEEKRLREKQRLAGFIFPEDVDMEGEVLPDITSEMNAIIDRAYQLPGSTIISSIFFRGQIDLIVNDILSLSDQQWLNDQVINFYMALIEIRSRLDGYPSTYTFNTFYYPTLIKGVEKGILRWTKKIDLFSYDLILIPIHLGVHWALTAIDNRIKVIYFYDSMAGKDAGVIERVEEYIYAEYKHKKKAVLPPNSYRLEKPLNIPKQMNGSDCGMFTLKYAEYLSRDAPLTFSQENMPYFRRRMVYELIAQQIL